VWRWGGTVRVGSRWSSGDLVVEGPHRPLPADLVPAGSQIVPLPLIPPEPGRWTLTLDLVHEHVRWFGCELQVEAEVLPGRVAAVLDPGTDHALFVALEALDPEEEPLVLTERAQELARTFAGRVEVDVEALAGATRLVVPDELVRGGRRRPLLAAVRVAGRLGIPAQTVSGAPLTAGRVVRRRLR
jgi:hypothetical protein